MAEMCMLTNHTAAPMLACRGQLLNSVLVRSIRQVSLTPHMITDAAKHCQSL
ncbi:hypothetical protein QE372_004809 [Agrobacterium pusense]|nr:hypothetical protein [Agrobacterium pusense]